MGTDRAARRLLRILAVALLPLLPACPSFTTMGPARTVPRGEAQSFVSGGAYRTTLISGEPPFETREETWLPLFEAGARLGLADRVDLELRAGTGGAAIGPRFQLARSPTDDAGVDLLVATELGFSGVALGDAGVVSGFTAGLALALGVNLGGGSQVVLGPRAAFMNDELVGRSTFLGGSLALVLALGGRTGRRWYLVPECAVAAVEGGTSASFDGPVVQCALGLVGPGGLLLF
ncbi:MAG TPA: hypothetical protein VLS93_12530 [Anaeromyxobacteraceae bacterium]|nr:hypothetical protein [Anaeromyxobacteraceae bacterium]